MSTSFARSVVDNRAPARAISRIRRFVAADIPQVADVHRRVFGTADAPSPELMDSYRRYFEDVFLNPPVRANGIHSLVCEESSGSVMGFLGVHPRRVVFEERPLLMAVCSQFVVDPARRGVAGLRMVKEFLEGPQDLSYTDEAGDGPRRLWEWCGGKAALLYSIHWLRPLRAAQATLSVMFGRRSPRLARLASPMARLADSLYNGRSQSAFRATPPQGGSRRELDETTLASLLPELADGFSLRPDYADGSLPWILRRASTRRAGGPFRSVLVRDDNDGVAGWFLYFAAPDGIGEVLQVAARNDSAGLVLDHLMQDAWQAGVIALAGRMDPRFTAELAARYCLFYPRGYWTLVHSRHPEVINAIERGDAFLTRMEGEWCLRFQ